MPGKRSHFKVEERKIRGVQRRLGHDIDPERIRAAAEVAVNFSNKKFGNWVREAKSKAAEETLRLVEAGEAVSVGSSTCSKASRAKEEPKEVPWRVKEEPKESSDRKRKEDKAPREAPWKKAKLQAADKFFQ